MSATPIPARLEALPRRAAHAVAPPARPLATSLCLAAADAAAVLASCWLGLAVWNFVNPTITASNQFHPLASAALFLLAYFASGLYAPAGVGPIEELRRIVVATALVSLLLTAALFLTKAAGRYSRGVFLATGALVLVLAPLSRAALRRVCARRPWWGVPVLVFGAGRTARLVVKKLREQPGLGFKPVACLDDDPAKHTSCAGLPVPGPLALAPEIAARWRVRHLLVAMPSLQRERLIALLERYARPFARVIVIPNLFGVASLWVRPHDLGGVLGLELRQNLLDPGARLLKRLLDLALAAALALPALAVIAVAALWIRRISPGPVFYTQEREGAGGARIRVRKLRTMHLNADELLERHLAASPAARAEWRRHLKLRHDPRVLPGIGRFLRRTSLDELPQLWNVLRGEMSLVGPRPLPAYHLERFDAGFRALRARVRPGLTGLWQVTARADGDLEAQRELDSYYIRNWSLWLELHILARTVGAVLSGRGAY
jgi:Undecaprenyl-phosphate galactose phosphotransferase WbaP